MVLLLDGRKQHPLVLDGQVRHTLATVEYLQYLSLHREAPSVRPSKPVVGHDFQAAPVLVRTS